MRVSIEPLQWRDTERAERKAGTLFMLMMIVPMLGAIAVLLGWLYILWS